MAIDIIFTVKDFFFPISIFSFFSAYVVVLCVCENSYIFQEEFFACEKLSLWFRVVLQPTL